MIYTSREVGLCLTAGRGKGQTPRRRSPPLSNLSLRLLCPWPRARVDRDAGEPPDWLCVGVPVGMTVLLPVWGPLPVPSASLAAPTRFRRGLPRVPELLCKLWDFTVSGCSYGRTPSSRLLPAPALVVSPRAFPHSYTQTLCQRLLRGRLSCYAAWPVS